MAGVVLSHCPTCGTKNDADTQAKLGLRDYRWLSPYLPGRVAPTDIDLLLETNGHFLVLENKPRGKTLPTGQRIMLKRLVQGPKTIDVWVVHGDMNGVEAGSMDRNGDVKFSEEMPTEKLAERAARWFTQHAKSE